MKKNKEQRHPEDLIYEVKQFLNELSNVQEERFLKLCEELKLNQEGENYLFDYIHNSTEEDKHLTFEEYISFYNKSYKDFIKK